MYMSPSLDSAKVLELAYGDKIELIKVLPGLVTVKLNNKTVKSKWAVVRYTIQDGYEASEDQYIEAEYASGYIPEVFLHSNMYHIPPHTLYNYYNLYIQNDSISSFSIVYPRGNQ